MVAQTFRGVDALAAAVGRELGPSEWLTIDRGRVGAFAKAVGDDLGSELADTAVSKAFLVLSLIPHFVARLRRIEGVALGVNYGIDRVRFPSPVRVGDRVRGRTMILAATEIGAGRVHLVARTSLEAEGVEKPCCMADLVSRLHFR